jgi:exopolysaccharide production protein ExoQ
MNQVTESTSARLAFWFWFILGLKASITYVFFRDDLRLGTTVTNAVGPVFIALALFLGSVTPRPKSPKVWPTTARWIAAYIGWSALSLLWTESQSLVAAFGYWVGYVSEIVVCAILLRSDDPENVGVASLKGYVVGNLVLLLVALNAPGTLDLRIGQDELLHPTWLGYQFAMATLFCLLLSLYIKRKRTRWIIAAILFGAAQLQAISKSSIIGFVGAASLYLLFKSGLKLRVKMAGIVVAALLVLGAWNSLESYFDRYSESSMNLETLTGRTVIWATSAEIASERPIIGHGFYSYRTLVPLFGTFEAVHAHNELIQQWFTYGAVGVFLAAMVYVSFYRNVRGMRSLPADLGWCMLIFSLIRGIGEANHVELCFPLALLFTLTMWTAEANPVQEAHSLFRAPAIRLRLDATH